MSSPDAGNAAPAKAATADDVTRPRRSRLPRARTLWHAPATTGLAALAVCATLTDWLGAPLDTFVMQDDLLHDAPWRPFTSALLHLDALHLGFNVYWLLVLGIPLERELGSVRAALAYAAIAFTSSLPEQALFSGGVGLSGIVYGAFAYGYVRSRSDAAWIEVVDRDTTRMFVGWFVFCIVATVADAWHVANVAHGVGALTGGLLAMARTRRSAALALVPLLALTVAIDVRPVRDLVNRLGRPSYEAEIRGIALLESGDTAGAVRSFARASRLSPGDARVRFNLGIALMRAERIGEACAEFRAARELGARDEEIAEVTAWCSAR